jgi:glycosyltransferase involved in cell wall biosynthesis/predicted TPR repeat methyltransferase
MVNVMSNSKPKVGLVLGSVPSIEEVDYFRLLTDAYDFTVVASESICGYISQTSYFTHLTCIALHDHDENPTFLPGLEKVLEQFETVIVKERLGLYAYQVLKAKWRYQFRLAVWVDNLVPFAAHDVDQMRTIRTELTHAADCFLVQSNAARHTLELEGVASHRIQTFTPWIDDRIDRSPAGRAKARQALGLAESDLVISYLGQIEWEEGLSDLIAASKLMLTREPSLRQKLRIVICGVGSYSSDMRDIIKALGLEENIVYYAPMRDANRAIQQATDAIYIAPLASRDRAEGDPYRILAAMVHGIPLLASRTPIAEELCGKHRIDFCPSSPVSLAKAIQRSRSMPNVVSDIIGKNQKIVAERFTAEKARDSLISALAAVMRSEAQQSHSSLDIRVLEIEAKVKNKQYIEAVDLIESVFKMDQVPVHHRANLYRLIGDCFAKLGDIDGAKDAYNHGAELDPYSAKIYIGLGTVGLMKGSNDVAVLHLSKAVNLAPDDEMANFGLGLAFQGMGEQKEAARWINKALAINPENTAAIFSIVRIAHESSVYEDAIKAIERYLKINPNDYNFIYTLGGLYFKTGHFETCARLMKQILQIDPKDKRAAALAKQAKAELEQKASSSNG